MQVQFLINYTEEKNIKMPIFLPPKEIMNNIKFGDNSVYLVGEVTEEQKKIFRKFKKEVEDTFKRSRVEVEPDDSFKKN